MSNVQNIFRSLQRTGSLNLPVCHLVIQSPAEFQKRLVYILQPFIEDGRAIVYIDDIMIASDTVEANLETLRDVLKTLKKHNFELNLTKCKFLRKEIEYLGYTISCNNIYRVKFYHQRQLLNRP